MPVVRRSKSCTPSCDSSRLMMRLSAGCVTCSASAASPRLPVSMTARKAFSWRGSKAIAKCYDFRRQLAIVRIECPCEYRPMTGRAADLVPKRNTPVGEPCVVREAAFRLFRTFGLTTIFGNPGSTELPMFRDFPADFRYVLGLQESIAVGMADGFAQATRRAALVNLHSATGVGHALGNIFTAYRNQTPLVITAGQQARSILPFEPFLYAQQATEFPKPYVKWSCEPARAADVPAAIARAYYTAMQPPRGPTFVSIPVDDWDRACSWVEPRIVSRSTR